MMRGRTGLLLAAALALATNPLMPAMEAPAAVVRSISKRQKRGGLRAIVAIGGYLKRPRQTHKQARRQALKARAKRRAA